MGWGNSKPIPCTQAKDDFSASTILRAKNVQLPAQEDVSEVKIESKTWANINVGKVTDFYQIGKKIGEGAFGIVHEGIWKLTGEKRAIKTISVGSRSDSSKFLNEVNILRNVDHPNIIKLYEFFSDQKRIHIVTELWTGGELFDYLIKQRRLNEQMTAMIMKQLISVVAHCHERQIVHRDLKPENLLLEKTPTDISGNDLVIKVIDFGTSALFDLGRKLRKKEGSLLYIAPEILTSAYDERCDVWSAGVILYILLIGYPPFSGKNVKEIQKKIVKGQYSWPQNEGFRISNGSQNLISRMLVPQNKRPGALELLSDPWLVQNTKKFLEDQSDMKLVIENLSNFRADRKLQQAVLSFITSHLMSQDDLKQLRSTFQKFDKNGDGKLSRQDLVDGYSGSNDPRFPEEVVDEIMAKVDTDQSGFIDWSEFLTASVDQRKILSKQNLEVAFSKFDNDGSGSITVNELQQVLGAHEGAEDEVWGKVLKEVDQDGNGEIDLKEFKDMMIQLF